MNKYITILASILLITPLTSISQTNGTKSKYFRTEYSGIEPKYAEGVKYTTVFSTRKRIRKDMYLTVIYEDPANKNKLISEDSILEKGKQLFALVSPIIKKIENAKTYKVELLLYKDAKRTKLVNTHIQYIDFNLSAEKAAELNLEFIFSGSDESKINHVVYKSQYPIGSGVAVSELLERDAINALKVFLNQKYNDDSFEIISRESNEEVLGSLVVDDRGRLVAGTLRENWVVKQNDNILNLEFMMFSDGKLGNHCGFMESIEEKNYTQSVMGWTLNLESADWILAKSQSDTQFKLSEYILTKESASVWSDQISSSIAFSKTDTIWMHDYMLEKLSDNCPTFKTEVIEKNTNSILFKWSYSGCHGNTTQTEIRKLQNHNNSLYTLAKTWREIIPTEQEQQIWAEKLKSAHAKE